MAAAPLSRLDHYLPSWFLVWLYRVVLAWRLLLAVLHLPAALLAEVARVAQSLGEEPQHMHSRFVEIEARFRLGQGKSRAGPVSDRDFFNYALQWLAEEEEHRVRRE